MWRCVQVQGFELKLLRGARKLLAAQRIACIAFELATDWLRGLARGVDTIGTLRSNSATEPLEKVQVEVTAILDRAAARRERRGQPDPWETA